MPHTICPECSTGKHRNCDGVADLTDEDIFVPCHCSEGDHPFRPPSEFDADGD